MEIILDKCDADLDNCDYPCVFTALHEMQTPSSDENSVCLSVRLSVCHTRDPNQNGRKIGPDFYTI